jgi:hypothetical protein
MAPFHAGDNDHPTSQASPQHASTSHEQVPSLEKPLEPKKRDPIHASSQVRGPRKSVTTLKASRPPPMPTASRRLPATQSNEGTQNQVNRGRSTRIANSSLGLQLESSQQTSTSHQYRQSEVDELNEMVSRMRTLSHGGVSTTF